MKQEFLRTRFVGQRFNEHSLPLDILKDFSALEEMLLEVAKHQYLTMHPERTRAPKGFTKEVQLHLTSIEQGSAIAVIALSSQMLFSISADYFEQAKNKIIESVAAVQAHRPPTLPTEFLRYFERFGRGLQEGEAIEFTDNNGQKASLTKATRLRLLDASQAQSWTEETTLKGRVPEIDQADNSFELELDNGIKIKAPLFEIHQKAIFEAFSGYRSNIKVAIKGIIERDRTGRPQRFELIEHVFTIDPLDVTTRLEELAQLQNGWLDGTKGQALNQASLIRLAQAFDEAFNTTLPLPHLYPTPEGDVQAEWSLGVWEVSLEISLTDFQANYQAVQTISGQTREKIFNLAAEDCQDWTALNQELAQLLENKA